MSFSEDLKHFNIDIWNSILNHRFVAEIAKDILPISKFIFYLKQDQIFLESFCNLLAVAASITYDSQTKLWFEGLLDSTTKSEMKMQNEILSQLEGDLGFIETSAKETTREYISYMKRVSDSRDLAIIVSAMAPCPWTYYDISQALIKSDIRSDVFTKWIRFYSSNESLKQVNEITSLLNKLAMDVDEQKEEEMKNHFSLSCNYELKFWDMAYSYMK
jgi:thiaminase/transcriptional activator TenA